MKVRLLVSKWWVGVVRGMPQTISTSIGRPTVSIACRTATQKSRRLVEGVCHGGESLVFYHFIGARLRGGACGEHGILITILRIVREAILRLRSVLKAI